MSCKQKTHDDVFKQLVIDLKTKKKLCRVKDYPGVELKQLNDHVKKVGPLENPVFGEQSAFFIDDDDQRFIPYKMAVYGNVSVAAKIASLLDAWVTWSDIGGRTTTSQGAFVFNTEARMPDVAYTPRDTHRGLSNESTWTYRGEPFAHTFVVEIDKLSGPGSQRKPLDRKMRNDYFQHGVQLGWLIDPRPGCRRMYEYYLDNDNKVQCSDNIAWRNLDGRDVLPGFTIVCTDLNMVLNQDPGSSEEEEVNLVCPIPRCRKRFRSLGTLTAHVEWHRAERARQKYLARHEDS